MWVGLSWWGRYWIRNKLTESSQSSAIQYCTQLVLAIALDLNMVSYIFWLLISFAEVPWWWLVCYVQAIITTTRDLFVTYCCPIVNIKKVSYRYCSYLCYCQIHLSRYICCYSPLFYDEPLIVIMFYFKLSRNFAFLNNIKSIHLWYFQTQRFCNRQGKP